MKISKNYNVTIEIDTEKAQSFKNGVHDWDSYPNWDINFRGNELEFVNILLDELQKHNEYSGINIVVAELEN